MKHVPLFIVLLFTSCLGNLEDWQVTSARIESCTGCRLAKYPEVMKFIELDIQEFDDVTFKEVPGSFPEIVFFNKFDRELERHPLTCKSRKECMKLLLKKGLKRNTQISSGSHIHKDI